MADTYYTIAAVSEGIYKEKMSKFISFAIPVETAAKAKEEIAKKQNEYHDARHVCWAFMLGPKRTEFLSNDNGEPSGTAGKPILGQINSFGLTDVVVIVVRYFGGIKLGTSGLIAAYREAARLALQDAQVIECHEKVQFHFNFPYISMNEVMKVVKQSGAKVLAQQFDNVCSMSIEINADQSNALQARLDNIDGVTMCNDD